MTQNRVRLGTGTEAGLYHSEGSSGALCPGTGRTTSPPAQGQITHWTRLRYSWGVLGGTEGSKPSVKSQGSTGNSRGINSSIADSAGTQAMVLDPVRPNQRMRSLGHGARAQVGTLLAEPSKRQGLGRRNCTRANLLIVPRLSLR